MPLTPEEQANVDAGLTTDGRPMEPCLHQIFEDSYDDPWWAEHWYGNPTEVDDNEIQAILDDPTG